MKDEDRAEEQSEADASPYRGLGGLGADPSDGAGDDVAEEVRELKGAPLPKKY